ncbi:MAG: ankyrin repeat domain-containing protein [Gammaproteobacteria bacterium]|nr:ankyrin repeat domain-containing protein [Gammaproteobacteria bacterium]MDE0444726.1 ankyrin repeat domain-containing protein [Gammaproteobacteria bacterium]
MSSGLAVNLFHANWFLRNQPKLDLTDEEQAFIVAALGQEPKRWDGEPDPSRMVELLADDGDLLDRIGSRLLNVAIGMRRCGATVKLLIERGVELDIDRSAYNVLHEAAWAGATDTLAAVFESGASDATPVSMKKPHAGWPDNVSLMYWVAWGGYPDLAKLLIAHGVGVHHELAIKGNGERGTTSLHEAVAPGPWQDDNALRSNTGKRAVAQILIEDGAHYDAFAACGLGDGKRLRTLIAADADVASTRDAYGMTPLHWAARAGAIDCTGLLLENGASVDAPNKARRAPLQLAAEADQAQIIRLLARQGADLNTQDRKGRTPLHRATYEGRVAAAEALLEVGADPMVVNKRGKNAFEIARKDAKYFKDRA